MATFNKEKAKEAINVFKELYQDGIISEKDYNSKKDEILNLLSQEQLLASIEPTPEKAPTTSNSGSSSLRSSGNHEPVKASHQAANKQNNQPTHSTPPPGTRPKSVTETLDETLAEILGSPIPWTEVQAQIEPVDNKGKYQTHRPAHANNNKAFTDLQNVATLSGHANYVFALVYDDDSQLFSASGDRTIKVWDLETLECKATLKDHENNVYALALNRTHLFSGSWDNTIRVWDLKQFKCQKTLKVHTNYVSALAISDNIMYSGSWDMNIQIWDLNKLDVVATILKEDSSAAKPTNGHTNCISCVKIAGNMLVSGSYDNTVKVWSRNTLQCKATLRGHTNWVYSLDVSDDKRIFTGSRDNTIKVWSLDTGTLLHTIKDHNEYVTSISILGNKLYVGSMDKTVKIYDLNNLKCLQTLTGHQSNVYTILPTESTLFTGSWDKTVKIWQ